MSTSYWHKLGCIAARLALVPAGSAENRSDVRQNLEHHFADELTDFEHRVRQDADAILQSIQTSALSTVMQTELDSIESVVSRRRAAALDVMVSAYCTERQKIRASYETVQGREV